MIVVGGYNSSNTCNLARICADARADVSTSPIRTACVSADRDPAPADRRAVDDADDRSRCRDGWLPPTVRVVIGLTAGASTPNNIVGQVIETVSRFVNSTAPADTSGQLVRFRLTRS